MRRAYSCTLYSANSFYTYPALPYSVFEFFEILRGQPRIRDNSPPLTVLLELTGIFLVLRAVLMARTPQPAISLRGKLRLPTLNYNQAFRYAIRDLEQNAEIYLADFLAH